MKSSRFTINHDLLAQARAALQARNRLYWVVGGAGAGKTTVCQVLSATHGIGIYDMDAHIYGDYHARFSPERHPVNDAWSTAANSLAWLLDMTWDEFDNFNQAALPEYLDLLVEDLAGTATDVGVLIDGGICNPALVARVIPARQIVCLAAPEGASAAVWEAEDRRPMKDAVRQLPRGEAAWQKFLQFDACITATILAECRENDIAICARRGSEPVDACAGRVAHLLGIR